MFVCTGNTCRSPMAEALLREAGAARAREQGVVYSAGPRAGDGAPGSEHRARLLTRDLVRGADLILVMSGHHLARVAELGGEDKAHLLGEYAGREPGRTEVHDPFGSDLASYRNTYTELQELIGTVVSRVAGTVR